MTRAPILARACAAGAAILAVLAATVLHAQSPDPYDDLVAALVPEDFFAADFRRQIEGGIPAQFAAEPEIAGFERECPGAIDSMVAAVGPLAERAAEGFRAGYRADFSELLAAELSAAEAREAAEFYTSGPGQRMMAGRRELRQHANVERSIEAREDGTVDGAALARDQLAAAEASQAALSDQDRAALQAAFETTSWGRTIRRLRPAITALQVRFANAFLVEHQAAIGAAVEAALAAHFKGCD